MSNAIKKLEEEIEYLETLSPAQRIKYVEKQEIEYDPIWDEIFEIGEVLDKYNE